MGHPSKVKNKFEIFKFLSHVLASLSIVMLIKHGFQMSDFAAPLQLVLEYYETLIEALIGWAEPYLREAIAFINKLIGWRLTLEPQWKHIFVLMMLFFAALTRHYLQRADEMREGTPLSAAYLWALGFVVSLITSICLGVVPRSNASGNPIDGIWNGVFAAVPLVIAAAVFVVYGVADWIVLARKRRESWWKLVLQLPGVLILAAVGLLFILILVLWIGGIVGNFSSDIQYLLPLLTLPRPLLILLGLIALAAFFIVWGALNARRWTLLRGTTWRKEFLRSTWTSIGFSMFIVLGNAAAILLCNAGLKLLGL